MSGLRSLARDFLLKRRAANADAGSRDTQRFVETALQNNVVAGRDVLRGRFDANVGDDADTLQLTSIRPAHTFPREVQADATGRKHGAVVSPAGLPAVRYGLAGNDRRTLLHQNDGAEYFAARQVRMTRGFGRR